MGRQIIVRINSIHHIEKIYAIKMLPYRSISTFGLIAINLVHSHSITGENGPS